MHAVPIRLTTLLSFVLLGLFVACGTPDNGSGPAPNREARTPAPLSGSQAIATVRAKYHDVPANVVVSTIPGGAFENLTIKKGTTVVWVNEDINYHSVTAYDIHGDYDSGALHFGDSFSHTFDRVGVSRFHCLHADMEGTVTVTP